MDVLDLTTGYCRKAFADQDELLNNARRSLLGVSYDTMVCTGSSGAALVPWLARMLNKHFVIVRKESENSHSGGLLNGKLGSRWIFVDDFIDGGSTLKRVLKAVNEEIEYRNQWQPSFDTEFVGSYLYSFPKFERIDQGKTARALNAYRRSSTQESEPVETNPKCAVGEPGCDCLIKWDDAVL